MSARCFHCDEPVPRDFDARVSLDGVEQPVCCLGCEAIMQAIVAAGLGNYYRHRTEPAVLGQVPDALAAQLASYAIYDEPECRDDYVDVIDAQRREIMLTVENIRCGACVWLLERSLLALDGVYYASVNFASARAVVRFDVERVAVSEILACVAERGFSALPFAANARVSELNQGSRRMVQRLFVAGIGSMQVMMYALPEYVSAEGAVDPVFSELLAWAACALTVPVLLFSAHPFFAGAVASLKNRIVGMDVPVSLALVLTTLASVHSLQTGQGETYFDLTSSSASRFPSLYTSGEGT
ncbi:MAG: heavy metal translocating P-type ATPase metal-binding domain-containing protein [Pseudomonadota bacterium]